MIVRFEDVITRITGNVDRYNTDLEYYVGGDQYDSSSLTIERRGDLKKDVDILGFKFHFPFKSGDVLLMARNPHLRKSGQVFFDGLCSDASYILRTKDEKRLRQNYIPIILQSNHFWDWFESHKTGGITFLLNWGMLKGYEFDLPDSDVQDSIMEKVWAAYKLKQSYQKLMIATDEMVKSRFIAWSSEWKSHTTIRDLVDTSADKASRKFKPDDIIRYIDISSVDGESNSVIGTTEYIFSEAPSRAQQCTRKGDILVSTVRPNLKNIAVNQLDEDNLVASSGFCVLRPKEEYSGLILAYILSEPFTLKMVAEAKGSNYPAIHDSGILDYPITVPESHELASVGVFVQQADKSKFSDFKSRFIEITKTERTQHHALNKLTSIERKNVNPIRGTIYTLYSFPAYDNNRIPEVIDGGDIKSSKLLLTSNTVLYNKLNVRLRRVWNIKELKTNNNICSSEFIPLKVNKDVVLQEYLMYCLTSDTVTEMMESASQGTSNSQQRISPSSLMQVSIPVIPKNEQKHFIELYQQSDKSKYLN